MKRKFFFAVLFALAIVSSLSAAGADSLGVVGNILHKKTTLDIETILKILSALVAVTCFYIRKGQRWLQGRRTIWRFVNNRLTLSLVDRVIGWLFGKTTLIYESKIECSGPDREAAEKEAARITAEHLLRKNGSDMLDAFAKAMNR